MGKKQIRPNSSGQGGFASKTPYQSRLNHYPVVPHPNASITTCINTAVSPKTQLISKTAVPPQRIWSERTAVSRNPIRPFPYNTFGQAKRPFLGIRYGRSRHTRSLYKNGCPILPAITNGMVQVTFTLCQDDYNE